MSAKRLSLLAAATVCGAFAPTESCWAQAYGAKEIVDHHDLRWFEPVELDIDGQMPRRDEGFFFSADKLLWSVGNPKVVIGEEGLVVDSERIVPATSVSTALTSLEQTLSLTFVDDVEEAFDQSSLRFATFIENDPTRRSDDIESILSFNALEDAFRLGNAANPALTNVTQVRIALERIESGYIRDPDGVPGSGDETVVGPQNVRVGGEPNPYGVENGIRDALPDAGFAWGERYEFGYSDGERGWMATVLDGPESQAGGIYGAGEGGIYFSQTGTTQIGRDPYFTSTLEPGPDGGGQGDGEGGAADLFALGFGSVAVNFNLTIDSYLTGFRDYNNNDTPFTVYGPIMYVGNLGSEFSEFDVIDLDLGGTGGSLTADAPQQLSSQLLTDVNGGTMTVATAESILSNLNASVDTIESNTASFDDDAVDLALVAVGTSLDAIQTAIDASDDPFNDTNKGTISTAIAALNTDLATLDAALANLDTGTLIGGGQDITVDEEIRQADDLNGDGASGFRNVVALVDGVPVIVGRILDYGDLYTFNVFFDQVTVRNQTEVDGFELMRTHTLSTRHKLQQGRWDGLRFSYGARFLSLKDDFYFQGLGSILGRTTVSTDVENQVVGPQIGLKWTRRDGPWNFVVEGRGTLGYNIVDVDQNGIFGEELVPGALNRPIAGRTTTTVDGQRYDEFSPLGELRAQISYRVAESISLQAGYTAKYVGNVHRGAQATAWNAPNFGIDDSTSDIFINGLNFGIELRH